MNAKLKKRLIIVSGIIAIVVILALAFIGGGTAARTVSVAEAATISDPAQKVQVSGNVVANSFDTKDGVLSFKIYDPEGDPATHLAVTYDGAASSTFGNDVTAICTGRVSDDGILKCSELVTKCPSKYENSTSALNVEQLLSYGSDIYGKTVKVVGAIEQGTLKPANEGDRFILVDESNPESTLSVSYQGALSDEVGDGSVVIVTGSLDSTNKFIATDVALGA